MPTRTRVKVSPEMGEGGSQEQECRQNKAQLINSLQVVNKKLAIMMTIIMTTMMVTLPNCRTAHDHDGMMLENVGANEYATFVKTDRCRPSLLS